MLRLSRSLLLLAIALFAVESHAETTPEQRLLVCNTCHGAAGVSKMEGVPSMGGMPRGYVLVQLILFREKRRVVAPMNALLAGLSDDDLQSMADLIAAVPAPVLVALPLVEAQADYDPDRTRALAVKYHCVSWHGSDLAGHGQVPRIAGQREEYVLKSLRTYQNNTRVAYQPTMIESVQGIPDLELQALAKFVSQFR